MLGASAAGATIASTATVALLGATHGYDATEIATTAACAAPVIGGIAGPILYKKVSEWRNNRHKQTVRALERSFRK